MTTHEIVRLLEPRLTMHSALLGEDLEVKHASSLSGADRASLVWFKSGTGSDFRTAAAIAIVGYGDMTWSREKNDHTTLVGVLNPRLEFARLAGELFPEPWPTMGREPYRLTDGFGWVPDEMGKLVKFPHYGGVKIDPTASVAPTACIARAPFGDTIVEEGVAIDDMVHIAHGARIGAHTSIAALSSIEGSVEIGKYCTIGSLVVFQVGSSCGNDVTVGSGSVVTKHIPSGETWAGVPARRMK